MKRLSIDAMKPYLYLTLIFICVHSLLVLNPGFFWDDYIWVQNPAELKIGLSELGVVFFKPFIVELNTWPIHLIKLFIFSCYYITGIFFYRALKMLQLANEKTNFWISCFFIVMPYNILGRSTICTAPYAISYLFFFTGYFYYLRFRSSHRKSDFLLTLSAFTFSFNTTSILIFYIAALTLTELTYSHPRKKMYISMITVSFFALLHATIFYLVKIRFFPVHGIYESYNKLIFSKTAVIQLVKSIGYFFLDPIAYSVAGKTLTQNATSGLKLFYNLIFFAPLAIGYYKKKNKTVIIALAAMGLIFAAVFPYIIVGKEPVIFGWDSRHQILFPAGAALWLLSAFSLITSIRFKNFLAVFLLTAFSIGTIRLYLSVLGLSYQETSLRNELKNIIDHEQPGAYILNTRGYPPGVMGGDWNFYELTGMLYYNYKAQNDFIILKSHMETINLAAIPESFGNYKDRYMVSHSYWREPFYCLKLASKPFNELAILKLLVYSILNPAEAQAAILDIYHLDKEKIDSKTYPDLTCTSP